MTPLPKLAPNTRTVWQYGVATYIRIFCSLSGRLKKSFLSLDFTNIKAGNKTADNIIVKHKSKLMRPPTVDLSRKFFLISIIVFSFSATHSQDISAKINTLIAAYNASGQFNGSALVIEKNKIIFKKSFGYADFSWNVPNSVDTKFRIGSITKSFTAALVLKLVEQGKLSLTDSASKYIPDFNKPLFDKITIKHLLTHTSGLPDYNNVPDFFRQVQSGYLTKQQIVKKISEYDLLFEPGTKFNYSNDGYRVLGAIIEKATSKPYEEMLEQFVLKPLFLTNTGYMSRTTIVEKLSVGYQKRITGMENAPFYEQSPASGMYSTIEDLYKYLQAVNNDKLLSTKDKELIWGVSPYGNAYGWQVSDINIGSNKLHKIMTEGTVYGFFARLVYFPNDNRTIVLLTNVRASKNYLPDIERGIMQIFYKQQYELPKKSIAEALFTIIKKSNINTAIVKYKELKDTKRDEYNFDESELNSLGYQLINLDKVMDAIEIFKLNVASYPQSSNVFDSLGEAYMLIGDNANAITNYQKSLDLDPSNDNAKQMIQKLRNN